MALDVEKKAAELRSATGFRKLPACKGVSAHFVLQWVTVHWRYTHTQSSFNHLTRTRCCCCLFSIGCGLSVTVHRMVAPWSTCCPKTMSSVKVGALGHMALNLLNLLGRDAAGSSPESDKPQGTKRRLQAETGAALAAPQAATSTASCRASCSCGTPSTRRRALARRRKCLVRSLVGTGTPNTRHRELARRRTCRVATVARVASVARVEDFFSRSP
jgi:hypothetical protein